MATAKLVPPDGGYGWMIVGAFALHHLVVLPLMQGSGLMFKDKFRELGFSATDTSLILNTHSAALMFTAIITGPLLKRFGYRKVSFLGATLITVGMISVAFANTFVQYIITYGLITAAGISVGFSSYPLALNSYFVKKRVIATGYAIAICGFGPVFIPQIISFALDFYGTTGGVLIIAAISSHVFVSSILLQPAKRHLIKEIAEDNINKAENQKLFTENGTDNKREPLQIYAIEEIEEEDVDDVQGEVFGLNTLLAGSMPSLYSVRQERSMSVSSRKLSFSRPISTRYSAVNLTEEDTNIEYEDKEKKKDSLLKRIGKAIVNVFDLTLLTSPTTVNVMFGMSLDVVTEVNFLLITPFILQDYGLNTQQIATFMSTLAIVDICFRFVAPYLSKLFKQPVRVMHMFALTLVVCSRFTVLLSRRYIVLLVSAAFLGLARGFRMVYINLLIPSQVPIERFAAALGLQSVLNGILICIGGPLFGYIRDVTGSYTLCVLVINSLTFLAVLAWGTEFAYKRWKSKSKADNVDDNNR